MWVKLAGEYLNLDNVAVIHFTEDDDGPTLHVEIITGVVRRYRGHEAAVVRQVLEQMVGGGSSSDTVYDLPAVPVPQSPRPID